MNQATVRISEHTRDTLRELARTEDDTMQAVLEKAVEAYRRTRLFQELDAAYGKLQEDPGAWADVEAERRIWDATLGDGLPEGENWGEDGAPEFQAKK